MESAGTQKLFAPLPNNLPFPGKVSIITEDKNLDRIEPGMLKLETE